MRPFLMGLLAALEIVGRLVNLNTYLLNGRGSNEFHEENCPDAILCNDLMPRFILMCFPISFSVCLSACLSVCINLPVCLFTNLTVCLHARLCLCLSILMHVSLPASQYVYQHHCLSVSLCLNYCLSVCLSACITVSMAVPLCSLHATLCLFVFPYHCHCLCLYQYVCLHCYLSVCL